MKYVSQILQCIITVTFLIFLRTYLYGHELAEPDNNSESHAKEFSTIADVKGVSVFALNNFHRKIMKFAWDEYSLRTFYIGGVTQSIPKREFAYLEEEISSDLTWRFEGIDLVGAGENVENEFWFEVYLTTEKGLDTLAECEINGTRLYMNYYAAPGSAGFNDPIIHGRTSIQNFLRRFAEMAFSENACKNE